MTGHEQIYAGKVNPNPEVVHELHSPRCHVHKTKFITCLKWLQMPTDKSTDDLYFVEFRNKN